MRVSAIREALSSGATADLEEAFTALVSYPHHAPIEGVRSVVELADLLDQVAHALRTNQRIMPDALADRIHHEVRDTLEDHTFGAGARAVRVYAFRWRSFFAAHFDPRGR